MKKTLAICLISIVVILSVFAFSSPHHVKQLLGIHEEKTYLLRWDENMIKQYFVAEGEQIYYVEIKVYGSGRGVTMNLLQNETVIFTASAGAFDYWTTWIRFSGGGREGDSFPINVVPGQQYAIEFIFDIPQQTSIYVMYDTEKTGGYALENGIWNPISGGWMVNISYQPAQVYNASVVLVFPPDGASGISYPPLIQFNVETDAPNPYYTIVFSTSENGKTYLFTVPYTPLPADGRVVYELVWDRIYQNAWVEWYVTIANKVGTAYKKLWTNYDDPWEFGIGSGTPPPPPDWVNAYYYLSMFPDSIDTSIYPTSDDWHGPVGYWYINSDNNHLIYQHPQKVDGYTWLIDVSPTLNDVAFWKDRIIEVTSIPYEVADASINKLDEPYHNYPPVADFTYYPVNPSVEDTITFDASASYDPDGEIVYYIWDFGDGITFASANAVRVSHSYNKGGIYYITLTVKDNIGMTSSKTLELVIRGMYRLTTNVIPYGAGSITISPLLDSYPEGTIVNLTAVPNAGYTFSHWEGDAIGSSVTTTVVMDGNKSVTAVFSPVEVGQYTLTVTAQPSNAGWIEISPEGGVYDYGTVVTISAHANAGYVFDHWEGSISGDENPITITMDSDKVITAVFKKTVFNWQLAGSVVAILSLLGVAVVLIKKC